MRDSTGYAESVSDKRPHLFGGSSSGPLLLHYVFTYRRGHASLQQVILLSGLFATVRFGIRCFIRPANGKSTYEVLIGTQSKICLCGHLSMMQSLWITDFSDALFSLLVDLEVKQL